MMKKSIIIAKLFLLTSIFAIETTQITIYPNEITGYVNRMLFGSTARLPVYDSVEYAPDDEYYEFNSKRMAGLWDDSLDLPDTLFKEYFRKTNMNIISIETGGGRAKWQTMIGGDSDWRDRLYWPDTWSYSTLADMIEFVDSIGAVLLIDYQDYLDTSYFYTDSADTSCRPWKPDFYSIFEDFEGFLDYIYGSGENNMFDSIRVHDGGPEGGFDIPIWWIISDDMPGSCIWTKQFGSRITEPDTVMFTRDTIIYNGFHWGDLDSLSPDHRWGEENSDFYAIYYAMHYFPTIYRGIKERVLDRDPDAKFGGFSKGGNRLIIINDPFDTLDVLDTLGTYLGLLLDSLGTEMDFIGTFNYQPYGFIPDSSELYPDLYFDPYDNSGFARDTAAGINWSPTLLRGMLTSYEQMAYVEPIDSFGERANTHSMGVFGREGIDTTQITSRGLNIPVAVEELGPSFKGRHLAHGLSGSVRSAQTLQYLIDPDYPIAFTCLHHLHNQCWGSLIGYDVDTLPFDRQGGELHSKEFNAEHGGLLWTDSYKENGTDSTKLDNPNIIKHANYLTYEFFAEHSGFQKIAIEENTAYEWEIRDFLDTTYSGLIDLWETGLSIKYMYYTPTRKSDGNLSIIITSTGIDTTNVLSIALEDDFGIYDSAKCWIIAVDTTRMYSPWRDYCGAGHDYTLIEDSSSYYCFDSVDIAFVANVPTIKVARYDPGSEDTIRVNIREDSVLYITEFESSDYEYDTLEDRLTINVPPHCVLAAEIFASQDSVAIILHPGWNLVSIPMYTGDEPLQALFYENEDTTDMRDSSWVDTFDVFGTTVIETVTAIMRFEPTWMTYLPSWLGFIRSSDYRDSANTPGLGYWVYADTIETVWINGVRCYGYGVDLIKDFTDISSMVNMIGSIWNETSYIGNFQPDSILQDTLVAWYWSNERENYCDSSCIIPTWGYLVRANTTGFVSFPASDTGCFTSESELIIGYKDLQNWLHSPPGYVDTSSIACSISNDTIFVTNRDNQNTISGCMVLIETDDTTVIGYTDDQDGIFTDDLIDVNDSTYIFLYKPGYRKLLVYPYGAMDSDTFQSDIVIYGDITVGSDDTLVILPGTNIYAAYRSDMMQTWMAERIDIVVQGHIIAVGDSLAPITFTVDVPADSTPAPNDWKGIVHHYSGGGEYEHCRFEYMRYFQGHQPGGDVTFKNCTFAKPLYNAISYGTSRPSYIDPPKLIFEDCQFDTIGSWNSIVLYGTRDSTRITNCVFDSAASYVFEVKDSGKAIIEACSLNSCYGILTIHDYSSVTLSDCDLNTGGSWYGFNVYDAGTLNIDNSLIARSSSGKGPRIYNAGSAEFRYCSITDFTSDGISCESATADMGTDKDLGHNCVWSDHSSANRLYFATKTADEFSVFGNWIDTLIFGGPSASEIDTGNFFPPDSCDTSIAKIVIEPEDKSSILPEEFELGPARPNPFNSTVTFDYKVPVECEIEIAIYDILGKKIRLLFDGNRGSGLHSEVWDGKDDKGRTVASGTYLYRLKADDYEETRKMTFLK